MATGITHELKHKSKTPFPPKKGRHISNLKKEAVASQKGGSWREVRDYLDDTEARLEEFAKRADELTSKLESKAKAKGTELEDYYREAKAWLLGQVDKARALEAKTEELVDVARVKTHLAKKDAGDAAEELTARINKMMARMDVLKTKLTSETADMFKNLSDACLALRDKMVRKH